MFSNILVAVDGSAAATSALDLAIDSAQKSGAALHLVHVVREMQVPTNIGRLEDVEKMERQRHDALTAVGEQVLNQAKRVAQSKGLETVKTDIGSGDPATALLKYADRNNIDLIVMGNRGLGQVESLLMGSVSRKVTNLAKVPCLIAK